MRASASTSAAPTPTPCCSRTARGRDAVKTPTTDGRHRRASSTRCAACSRPSRAAAAAPIDAVMIGTTHFTNAVVQRRDLARVAAIRIGLPASALAAAVRATGRRTWPRSCAATSCMVEGGHEYDGRPARAVRRGRRCARRRGASATAGIRVGRGGRGVLAARTPPCEERGGGDPRARSARTSPSRCSHQLGRIGLLERENAALLNAAPRRSGARTTIAAFAAALGGQRHRRAALPHPERRHRHAGRGGAAPSPCTASPRARPTACGARPSCPALDDAVVVDVGGTTTDIGSLRHGFPREANNVVEVGGVRTLFRMPDLLSLGLGGGTLVDRRSAGGRAAVSVGYRLTERARVFGGADAHRHRRRRGRGPGRAGRPRPRRRAAAAR